MSPDKHHLIRSNRRVSERIKIQINKNLIALIFLQIIWLASFYFASGSVYDEQGNLLEERPTDSLDAAARKKISTERNKLEDLIQTAKQSNEGM